MSRPTAKPTFLSRRRRKSLRDLTGLLMVLCLSIASPSRANFFIYTSLVDFTAATSATATDTFAGFNLYSGTPSPITRTVGSYDYTASTSSSSFYGAGSVDDTSLSTNMAVATITFGSFTGGVQAVGGNFFDSNNVGNFESGDITITATDADGTVSQTIIAATTGSFLGFVSTKSLSSLTVAAVQPGHFIWPTVDNLVLGKSELTTPRQTFTYSAPDTTLNVRPDSTVSLSGTLGNTGAGSLDISLSSTGTLSVTDLSPSSGSVAISDSTTVTGTINTGTTAGAQDWQVTNTDATATNTTASISGTVNVYDYANAKYTGTTLDFGHVHQGATVTAQTVAFGNETVTNASYQDLLDVSAITDNAAVTATGFTGLAASTGGATTNDLSFTVDTSTVGSLDSTATLTLTSNANGVEGLSNGTATLAQLPTAITTTGFVYSGQGVWNTDGNGDWDDWSKWQTNGGAPGLDAGFTTTDTATFGSGATTANPTISLNGTNPSLKGITFDNATQSYTLYPTGGGKLTLNGGGSGATVTVSAGTHEIVAPVTLSDNTTVTVTQEGDKLTLSGDIDGTGSLTKDGSGVLAMSGTNTYTGSTTVSAGVLAFTGSLTGGGDVTVATGAAFFASSSISPAADQSVFINGLLSVQGPIAADAAILSITTSGTGAMVLGATGVIAVDLITGAGQGNNTAVIGASDFLSLSGVLSVATGGTLLLGNPNHMAGFQSGDKWQVIELNGGAGSITGTLAVNDSALGLSATQTGQFDASTGTYTIMDAASGLQMAAMQDQAVLGSMQSALSDINGHLFSLRAGGGEESEDAGSISASLDYGVVVGQGDGPEDKNPIAKKVLRSRQWEVFTTVNYANISLSGIGTQSGVDSQTWAPSVGIERHFTRSLTLGFAASFIDTHQHYANSLGTLDMQGFAFSTYASYVRRSFWVDGLYSFGMLDLDSTRNAGAGLPAAIGDTTAWTNSLQFNSGWNFRFQRDTFVTGPFIGLDYMHATVDAYAETGGGAAALAYGRRDFDSLISRVGWSASKRFDTDWATITPQLRLSYERQNITNNNATSATFVNLPFSTSTQSQRPGQDYMVLGTGVNFVFSEQLSLQLSYSVQLFRQDMQAHFGGVRIGYRF